MQNAEHTFRVGYYLIELLSAVLAERIPDPKPEDISLEELYKMAKKHSVESIAYPAAVQIASEEDALILQKWQERSMQCAIQGMVQLAERPRLYRELTKKGIRILPLKGCIMKELYPKQEYRQMADLDILIDIENVEKAKDVMEAMGYEVESFGVLNHDCYQKEPWLSVELHSSMMPDIYENAGKFNDIWERAFPERSQEDIYRLTWDDFYVFLIQHFEKHYHQNGSGIRSVMDIHVFLLSKAKELHRDYLEETFRELNLLEFEQNMRRIAAKWFKGSEKKTEKELEEAVIRSGVYGTMAQAERNYWAKREKKYHSATLSRLIYIFQKAFPGYEHMCLLYEVLKKYPFLMPFFWIHRLVKAVFKRQEEIRREFDKVKRYKKQKNG